MEYISTKEYADLHGLKDKSGGPKPPLFYLLFHFNRCSLAIKPRRTIV